MTTLVLGIVEQPYSNAPEPPRKVAKASKRPRKVKSGTQTTGDVATWLEAKYGVYQAFYDDNAAAIVAAYVEAAEGAVETLLAGGPLIANPLDAANSTIDSLFKDWLNSGAIEKMGIEGVPTKAALERRSLRFKNKTNPLGRPSFISSGLYEANFHSWTESR